ncbi:GGDEF domain-containing protein [Polymorphospora sp. NPDC051019]|uniref:GGDEF domain-containing protein n=1 Tax=Polymorphospora sp. NPDC051019 TaxID=3155725 RepID=UPI0034256912
MFTPDPPDRQPRGVHAVVVAGIVTAIVVGLLYALVLAGHGARPASVAFVAVLVWALLATGAAVLLALRRRRLVATHERMRTELAAAYSREHDLRQDLAAALTDPVTGLPVRAVAEKSVIAATSQRQPWAIALADADGLKTVNDDGGHPAGDLYLAAIADRLTAAARAVAADALVARAGGDEFVILAPRTDSTVLADAIRAAFAAPSIGHRGASPRVSVGVAASDGSNLRYALAQADAAMYTAKQTGNQILVYEPGRDGVPRADGTRTPVRRRDLEPGRDIVLPTNGAGPLVRIVCSPDDAATIVNALWVAHGRWAAAEPAPAATREPQVPDQTIDATPTAEGFDRIRALAETERAKYADLAARVSATLDMARRQP